MFMGLATEVGGMLGKVKLAETLNLPHMRHSCPAAINKDKVDCYEI